MATPVDKDARVHCAVLNQQPATTPHRPHPTRPPPPGGQTSRRCETRDGPDEETSPPGGRLAPTPPTGSAPPGPNSVPTNPPPAARPPHPAPEGTTAVLANRPRPASELVSVPPSSTTPDTRGHPSMGDRPGLGAALHHQHTAGGDVLLRKEVIQPHLPVRLPCYDFVPIADPAFDGSLPQGVGPPASGVTDFRDVTGGVYKARERIHRSIADLRLLATPTSWGRVADPNPN